MPWYKAGTVSVVQNSNAVIGSNTSFIANSRVGDAFLGPDGRWYEVTNIASDTAMAISPNYLGANNNAGAYALAPMQGYVKDSADALRALVNQFGAKLAALGTTGNYDILPIAKGGTGGNDQATARNGLGLGTAATQAITTSTTDNTPGSLIKVGDFGIGGDAILLPANTDWNTITTPGCVFYIPGATSSVAPATGFNWFIEVMRSPAGVLKQVAYIQGAADIYSRASTTSWGAWTRTVTTANAVGQIIQSGGVLSPLSAIIETGTTASGTYTKYADGTLVCSGVSANPMVTNTPGGNVFHSASVTFTFPAQFVGAVPKITHGSLTTVNYYSWTAMEGGIAANLTSTTLRLVSPVNSAQGYICYVARGRWY